MKNYKIIDTFMFNGEFEMLKIRLEYLNDVVDHFVICESNYTQNGKEKQLTYPGNEYLFSEYSNKITYLVYEPTQDDINLIPSNRFHLEQKHMDYIRDNSKHLSDENTAIMLSGVDEFPDKSKFDELWERIKNMDMDAISFQMKTFYCSPLCELDIDCFGTTVVNDYTFKNINRFSDLRQYCFQSPHIIGGWHLSFFHTPEEMKKKIEGYAHSEYNTSDITNIENIKYRIYNQLDVLNRPEIKIIKHDVISDDFPIEFYRHELFYRNTFERLYLKPQMNLRRNGSMQIPLEIENLQLIVAKSKPKVILEIGTANGGTLARWFEIPSVETIISVDYPIGIHGGQGFEERTYVISDSIEQANLTKKEFYPVNGDSKHPYLVQRVRELLNGRKIDFLFIDGDHTYNGVKQDFEIYKEFLHESSIVGFHDIIDSKFHRDENCFVSDFWDELKNKFNYDEFIYPHLLDKKTLPYMFDASVNKGGFAGIGIINFINYVKPKISLLVPVYNNANLTIENIKKTLSSSKYIKEVVIYSNGSNENENFLLSEYSETESKVKVFFNEKAIGFVKAVNEGIKKCKNELILCLNSDANLFSDWEERLLPHCLNERNGLIGPVLQDDFILGCAFIMKKLVINKIGMLNEGFGMGYHDDGELTDRIIRNGYDLGYCVTLKGYGEETRVIDFPMTHIQGVSFMQIDDKKTKNETSHNEKKLLNFRSCTKIKVLKNLKIEEIKSFLNDQDVFLVVNYSGKEFEKIRFDEDIVKNAHIFECTSSMNIDVLIDSITKGKEIEFLKPEKKNSLTWLAKFDDYTSMGILSQRIIEELKKTDVSCEEIIGQTETSNSLILDLIKKPINSKLGIMFSYPDMVYELAPFKNKVIYTGVDSTGGIENFADNCNKADFLLTPSNTSKKMMENLGVNKPIFVFPHGIEQNKFKFKPRKKENKFKFLYVGECSDRKGIFHLLNCFSELFSNNSNVELHLKSNSGMLFYGGNDVQNIVNKLPNVFWDNSDKGHCEILKLYDDCHAYVYPSRADTFGMTILEAMACGLPVISTSDPGVTELIDGRYYKVKSNLVDVKNHPWMKGKWGEPDLEDLKKQMSFVYENYEDILSSNILEENSNFVVENYSWEKVTSNFEKNILPKFNKKTKVLTLLTSFNRPKHIKNVINSLKNLKENDLDNFTYIVDNSNDESKNDVIKIIQENIDENFKLYVSDFNLGQRGALLQMLDDVNIDEYDFIQFTDQDNIFNDKLSTYCEILNENQDITFATGYMSKEHGELGWRQTKFGNLCEKRSLRAGHMFMRISDFKSLFPIHLDGQYGQPHNSSWNAGLDWELTYWNKNSIGKKTDKNFVLCVPNGVIHKGVDSTFYEWNVEENEYSSEELQKIRYF